MPANKLLRAGVLPVAATIAMVVPGVANGATVSGTVVAKDAKRGTIATAGRGGDVKTLRVGNVRRYRLGQRLVARAAVQADGTYAASRVKRRQAIAKRAQVRATVVQRSRGRYLVSAGSSTFSLASRGRGATAAAARAPHAGTIVLAGVRFGAGGVTATQMRAVGQSSVLELEGIFLDAEGGVLRLAVEKRGLVTVTIPVELEIAAAPGDEVEAIVSIASDGSFALIALKGEDDEDDDHGIDVDVEDGTVEIEGLLSALSETSVTVTAGPDASVTCTLPAGVSPVGFAVGDEVEMECRLNADGSAFELRELESETHELEVESDQHEEPDESEDDEDEDEDEED